MSTRPEFPSQNSRTEAQFHARPDDRAINEALRATGDALCIARTEARSHSKPWELPATKPLITKLSPEQQLRFEHEMEEDTEDLHVRLQRLKVRVLTIFSSGTDHQKDFAWRKPKNESEKNFHHISTLTYKSEVNSDELTEAATLLNKRLPREYTLDVTRNLNAYDQYYLHELNDAMVFAPRPVQTMLDQCTTILAAITECEKTLARAAVQGELFALEGREYIEERRLTQVWREYRLLIKAVAHLEESENWVSPSYQSSKIPERGRRQSSTRLKDDYQRFKMNEADELTRLFHRHYAGAPDNRSESMILGGGMNALQAIILAIEARDRHTSAARKPILKSPSIYGEVDGLIKDFYEGEGQKRNVITVDTTKPEEVIAAIKANAPAVLFLAPIANNQKHTITPITTIFEELSKISWNDAKKLYPGFQKLTIVIDNTAVGNRARWREFDWGEFPQFVQVIGFESLVKYGQDGQDLVPAALVTGYGEHALATLDTIQTFRGFRPPESTYRKLATFWDPVANEKKMERHGRNAEFLAQQLKTLINEDSFIQSVIYTQDSKEFKSGGSLIHVGFNTAALRNYGKNAATGANPHHQEYAISSHEYPKFVRRVTFGFLRLIIELARNSGVDLNAGTSFGFNTTRAAIYDYTTEEKESEYRHVIDYYLRLSVGTETIKDTAMIANILARANEIMSDALNYGKLDALAELMSYPVNIKKS